MDWYNRLILSATLSDSKKKKTKHKSSDRLYFPILFWGMSIMMFHAGLLLQSLLFILLGVFCIAFDFVLYWAGKGAFEEGYVEKVNQEELEELLRKRDILIDDIKKFQATAPQLPAQPKTSIFSTSKSS